MRCLIRLRRRGKHRCSSHLAKDRLEAIHDANVADRAQGIDDDVELQYGNHQVHLIRIDVELRVEIEVACILARHSVADNARRGWVRR